MHYTKMNGAGNDFVIIENRSGTLPQDSLSDLARKLCNRRSGIGADGMIVVIPAADADFGMLFFNSDGTKGEMCGNGARCISRYGVEHGLAKNRSNIKIRTTAGLVIGRFILENLYEVRLNDPSVLDLHRAAIADGKEYDCGYVELGNPGIPHAVVETSLDDLRNRDMLRERGRQLRNSPAFPRGANVTFAALVGPSTLEAITFERGVEDFTLACGTGCGAMATIFILRDRISGNEVSIYMPGGNLSVRLTRDGDTVRDICLTGPTVVEHEGEIE